jgi:hypothetical protein
MSMALWDNTHTDVRAVRGSAILGCSIMSPATIYDSDGTSRRTPRHCDTWQDDWARAAANGEIDLAWVQFGPWEVYDLDPDGPTARGVIGDPQIDALIEQNLTEAIESLLPHTRVVAIATSPDIEVGRLNGRSPDESLPESDPARMARLNEIILEVAARYPQVAVVDLASWVADLPDDEAMRPDGVHLEGEGAERLVEPLSTTLARLVPIDGVDPPEGPTMRLLKEPENVPAVRPGAD